MVCGLSECLVEAWYTRVEVDRKDASSIGAHQRKRFGKRARRELDTMLMKLIETLSLFESTSRSAFLKMKRTLTTIF